MAGKSLLDGASHKPLPPGLDPVTAGRFGLWLLGRRSHERALKRRSSPSRVFGYGIIQRLATLIAPWTVEEYPGYRRFLADLCGVNIRTSDDWLYGAQSLPRIHARRLSTLSRERGEALLAISEELATWADRPIERKPIERAKRGG